ncbi:MAG: PAS domain-containing sensor histidine kinase [Acidimicrobiia bacterium]|nr:PAS domain-containing sensor histidine kinase [Acidimicrobiia bacterium]
MDGPIIDAASLLSLTGDAVIRIAPDFTVLDADDRALTIIGITREEAIGRHLWSFVPPDEVDNPRREWLDFYNRDVTRVPMEWRNDVRIQRTDGSRFEAAVGAQWLEDGTAVLVFNNIEGRFDAERRVALLAQQYQDLFQNLPIAVWENDMRPLMPWIDSLPTPPDATAAWLHANPHLIREHVDEIRVQAINRAAAEQIVAESTDPDYLADTLRRGTPDEGIGTFPEQIQAIREGVSYSVATGVAGRADGSLFDVEVHQFIPTVDGELDLSRVLVTIIDTTGALRIQRQLGDAVSSRDQLITSVAHELRTPLTVVVGLMHTLAESHRNLPEGEIADLLALASAEADDLSHLVDDLLTYSRVGTGDHHIVEGPVDLSALVNELLARSFRHGGPPVEVEGTAKATGDPRRIRQIARNLLTNAARYGGPNIEVQLEMGDRAMLRVIDDGEGIPREASDVFAAYSRAHEGAGLPGAIGLGLTISRSLAEAMNGALTHRRVGGHTVFELSLPPVEE